jgi:hypothetical protein
MKININRGNMKLHHLGFIVGDIDHWEKNMIYETKIADVFDPLQNARLALYSNYSESFIELIQPKDKAAYTWNSLKTKGDHFSHFCYEVEDEAELKIVTSKFRMLKVQALMPAFMFEGKHICFYYTKNEQIVEFILSQS